ncbi:hypothetical protein [Bacillus mycoides]|uniref:Uncharacterized protein n=1 Tax=Bacillus mycoides TaxID=1405 RepID=A0A4U3A9G2_BACMY|nr:hypothetical protein [Bacillus mycoides]TKI84198.1 hypothetical protein FC701_14865 [Bacillus mycoides]
MSLANFQRNVLVSIRDENFCTCLERGWSVEEEDAHINVYDENNKLIGKFFGHISLSRFLEKLNKSVIL